MTKRPIDIGNNRGSIRRAAASITVAWIASLLMGCTAAQPARTATGAAPEPVANQQIPTPRLIRALTLHDLEPNGAVRVISPMVLVFSADSRYLAILSDTTSRDMRIEIWDLTRNRLQSNMDCPRSYCYSAMLNGGNMYWNLDDKTIFVGAQKQWNAMTGKSLPDKPVVGGIGELNKKGTTLLTLSGPVDKSVTFINLYNTTTWTVKQIPLPGFWANRLGWLGDNKIYVNAHSTSWKSPPLIDGYRSVSPFDWAVIVFDLSNGISRKVFWFPAVKNANPSVRYDASPDYGPVAVVNQTTEEIVLGSGIIVNGKALTIDRSSVSFFKKVFSDTSHCVINGGLQRMYCYGGLYRYGGHLSTKHKIYDLENKKLLTEFFHPTNDGDGLAFTVNSDGRVVAAGFANSIQLFRVE